jgi:hypothetical protein
LLSTLFLLHVTPESDFAHAVAHGKVMRTRNLLWHKEEACSANDVRDANTLKLLAFSANAGA